jgi:hypothetical protein
MEPEGYFDPVLAEMLSLVVHDHCKDCEHDIGMLLAVIAHEFYSEETLAVETKSK